MSARSNRPDHVARLFRLPRPRLSALHPKALVANLRIALNSGSSERKHCFVVGLSRSGTSALTSRLAQSVDIATAPGETFFFLKRDMTSLDTSRIELEGYVEQVYRASNRAALYDWVADQYIGSKQDAKIFLEKTPDHVFRIPAILRHFPNARIIACIRDPRDAYLSWSQHPKLVDSSPEAFATYWNRCADAIKREQDNEKVIIMRYEDWCTHPGDSIRDCLAHLGLSDLDQKIHEDKITPPDWHYIKTGGHERLAQPIDSASIGRWHGEMSSKVASMFKELCPRMSEFGYIDGEAL